MRRITDFLLDYWPSVAVMAFSVIFLVLLTYVGYLIVILRAFVKAMEVMD